MTRLFVTVSDLVQIHSRTKTAATELRREIGVIDDIVDNLQTEFEGQTAVSYAEKIDEWVTGALKLVDAIDGLAKYLDSAATAVRDVDKQLADALKGENGGVGASTQITADSDFLNGLSQRVESIARELESASCMFDGEGTGSGKVSGALEGFRKNWSDARGRMIESLTAAQQMTSSAAEVYDNVDSDLTKALTK